jgi:phospholipid transport system substrate-binding protein
MSYILRFGAVKLRLRQDIDVISRRLFLSSAVIALFGVRPAFAAGDAKAFVTDIGKDVLALANGGTRGKPLRGKFVSLLSRHVNLRNIANSALGTYRSKLPPNDKDKFYDLVTVYAAALFVWYIDKFKGADFKIDTEVKQGNFIVVKSRVEKSSLSNQQIVWYLSPRGNSFQVVDMSILGVRLSVAMRDAFSKELKRSKGDFNGLYAFLAEAETW